MALVVETGTASSSAESYASVAFADTYALARGDTAWGLLSTNDKEIALRKATDYMSQQYRGKWKGLRVNSTQALDWPRVNVTVDSFVVIQSNVVPEEIKRACVELASKSISTTLLADVSQGVIRKKVDVIEVEYDPNSAQTIRFLAIESALRPFLLAAGNSSGGVVRLSRV